MKKTLKLRYPIKVDGKPVSELTYDAEEITNELFLAACAKSTIVGNDMNASVTKELNTALHLQLGKAAVIAVNPSYDWGDLDRVKSFDLIGLCDIGRGFITGGSEEPSEQNNSDEQSENIQSSTTPASPKSESKE